MKCKIKFGKLIKIVLGLKNARILRPWKSPSKAQYIINDYYSLCLIGQ
jgi:hypothetical protein